MSHGEIHTITCEDAISFVVDACWGLATVSKQGSFEWVNPAFCEILGLPPDLIIGKQLDDFIHPADRVASTYLSKQVVEGALDSFPLVDLRLRKRGSTPQNEKYTWGLLSVFGKWEAEEFISFRVQYQPYENLHQRVNIPWKTLGEWGLKNWKMILTVLAVLLSWIGANSELLSQLVDQIKAVQEQTGP